LHIPRRHTPSEVDALFARERAGDLLGVRIHVAAALWACVLAGWPTTYTEWAWLPALVCFLIRMTGRHGVLEPLAYDWALRLLLAWGAWVGLSVWWSAAREHPETAGEWLHDVQSLRFLPLAVTLWPTMDRRGWLIGALAVGIACGQISQAVHLVGLLTHGSWQPFHRAPGRITGWWDPAVGGSVLCAGLGLWLSAAIFGASTRARWIGTLGALATLACIGLTGTRGAWIGGALLVMMAIGIGVWRVRPRRRVVRPFAAALAAVVAGAPVGYVVLSRIVPQEVPAGFAARLERGVEEVRGAFVKGDYASDTGMRIAMWKWAWLEARSHPIVGVGAGGFRAWAAHPPESIAGSDAAGLPPPHAHAHSWYLHVLAASGLVGVGLVGALAIRAVLAGFRGAAAGAQDAAPLHGGGWIGELLESLRFGPALALMGLACAGLFDSITVNQQTAYLFYLLVALCLPSRPREVA
jgi:O-antigen ligase